MQRYLKLDEVSQLLGGRSRSAIYQDIQAGRLPKPLKLGARIYWPEADLAEHLRALAGSEAAA